MKIQIFIAFLAFVAISSAAFVGRPNQLEAKECLYGPAYWCQNLTSAADCDAVTHCIQKVWNKQYPSDVICKTCVGFVNQAKDQMISMYSQEIIKGMSEAFGSLQAGVKSLADCTRVCNNLILQPLVSACDDVCELLFDEANDQMISMHSQEMIKGMSEAFGSLQAGVKSLADCTRVCNIFILQPLVSACDNVCELLFDQANDQMISMHSQEMIKGMSEAFGSLQAGVKCLADCKKVCNNLILQPLVSACDDVCELLFDEANDQMISMHSQEMIKGMSEAFGSLQAGVKSLADCTRVCNIFILQPLVSACDNVCELLFHQAKDQMISMHSQEMIKGMSEAFGSLQAGVKSLADCTRVCNIFILQPLVSACDNVCELLFDQAKDQMISMHSQEMIQETSEASGSLQAGVKCLADCKRACNILILQPLVSVCDNVCEVFFSRMMGTLANKINPHAVCRMSGMCNSATMDQPISENEAAKKAIEY